MSWKHFTPVPQDATLSFGGYSFVLPEAWEQYLDKVIREDYPDFFARHRKGTQVNTLWRDQESCILSSLENYLFQEFGVCIPEENLFKVFNKDGEGLDLSNIVEAISGVIEPLGLEIDRVLAADKEIRSALGESDRVIDEKQSGLVEGKPGLCMINVREGYNHAFFWRKIDPRGFKHEKFRLVVLIKKITGEEKETLSAQESLKSFLLYYQKILDRNWFSPGSQNMGLEKIHVAIEELEKSCLDSQLGWDRVTRDQIDRHLVFLLDAYKKYAICSSPVDEKTNEGTRILFEAGQLIRKVVDASPDTN